MSLGCQGWIAIILIMRMVRTRNTIILTVILKNHDKATDMIGIILRMMAAIMLMTGIMTRSFQFLWSRPSSVFQLEYSAIRETLSGLPSPSSIQVGIRAPCV